MTVLPMPLVTAEWLTAHLDEVVVADVRWYLDGRSGRHEFEQGHLPHAVFVDLDAALSADPGGTRGRHPLPTPQDFAAAMSALGIGDDTMVVAYDDTGGMTAARLVWMLRVLGEQAAVLDGGIAAWTGPLLTDAPVPTRERSRPGRGRRTQSSMPTLSGNWRRGQTQPFSTRARMSVTAATPSRSTQGPVISPAHATRPGPRTSTRPAGASYRPTSCASTSPPSVSRGTWRLWRRVAPECRRATT